MRIALIQCPSWTPESPPYTLGILSAVLKRSGHDVSCFDLNIETYAHCQNKIVSGREAINRDSWSSGQQGNIWYEQDKVEDFMRKEAGFVNALAESVLDSHPQVIGFSTQSTSKFFSLRLAALLKQKNNAARVIFGGPLVFKNCYGPDILQHYPFLDAVSFAEADRSFPDYLRSCEARGGIRMVPGFAVRAGNGEIMVSGDPPAIGDLDELPFADYSGFNLEKYSKKLIPIATSRGCINRCSFCSESTHWRQYRRRSAQNIIDEMIFQLRRYPHITQFWFNDSLINGDMRMLDTLCELIIRHKLSIKWGGQGMIRKEMRRSFLAKMKRAGCSVISYGVESGSNRVLALMRKGYTAALAHQVIKDTHASGIEVIFNIITGFPGEDEASFRETKDFILRCRRYAIHIELPVYLLLKGSYIFDHLNEFGIAPIDYNGDWQLKWKTNDNMNTYEVRQGRWRELNELLPRRSSLALMAGRAYRIYKAIRSRI